MPESLKRVLKNSAKIGSIAVALLMIPDSWAIACAHVRTDGAQFTADYFIAQEQQVGWHLVRVPPPTALSPAATREHYRNTRIFAQVLSRYLPRKTHGKCRGVYLSRFFWIEGYIYENPIYVHAWNAGCAGAARAAAEEYSPGDDDYRAAELDVQQHETLAHAKASFGSLMDLSSAIFDAQIEVMSQTSFLRKLLLFRDNDLKSANHKRFILWLSKLRAAKNLFKSEDVSGSSPRYSEIDCRHAKSLQPTWLPSGRYDVRRLKTAYPAIVLLRKRNGQPDDRLMSEICHTKTVAPHEHLASVKCMKYNLFGVDVWNVIYPDPATHSKRDEAVAMMSGLFEQLYREANSNSRIVYLVRFDARQVR